MTEHSNVGTPLFKTDCNALSKLIIEILERFGVLSSEQIHHLVSCYAPFGLVGPDGLIKGSISSALNHLMLVEHKIVYLPNTGDWKLSNEFIAESQQWNLILGIHEANREPLRQNNLPEIYGIGSEFVYVLYETRSRVLSIVHSKSRWLMKIGRTNNLDRRIADLNQSANSTLVLGMAFRTNDSRSLERFIHSYLRNQQLEARIPGRREWFYSNLDEIRSITKAFNVDKISVA
jgi:hypothetical protein